MDLWQLSIFCKVVELKSFSKAGKFIHLSQPTVSSHIKDLENYFGCRLIDRLSKEAVPTKAGELLYDYAVRIIALRDKAEAAIAEFQGVIKGRLVMGGSTIPGVYFLPEIIGAFLKAYPKVTISLAIGDTQEIVESILKGCIELGIVGAKSDHKQIIQENFLADELCLVVPRDHKWAGLEKISMDMLLKEPFIIREHGSGTLKSIKKCLKSVNCTIDDLNVIAELGSTGAVVQGIKGKIGISIVSKMAVKEELTFGTLKALSISGIDLKRNFYITTHRHRDFSPIAKTFTDFLRSTGRGGL